MGGKVKIGIRDGTGRVVANTVYTSCISPFFDNVRFINHDMFHFQKYLRKYCSDPTTGHYCAPEGYGLVFADFKTKKIHSMQGYATPGSISEVCISLCLNGSILANDKSTLDSERFKELYGEYITSKSTYDPNKQRYKVTTLSTSLAEELVAIKDSTVRAFLTKYTIDFGFAIIRYQETRAGIVAFRENLEADGIVFAPTEIAQWDAELKEKIQCAEDDGEEWDLNPYYEYA